MTSAERDVLYERFSPQYMYIQYIFSLYFILELIYLAVVFFITKSKSVAFWYEFEDVWWARI